MIAGFVHPYPALVEKKMINKSILYINPFLSPGDIIEIINPNIWRGLDS